MIRKPSHWLQSVVVFSVFGLFSLTAAQAWELEPAYGSQTESQSQNTSSTVEVQQLDSCKPVGSVVYRKASYERETGELLPGRLEGLESVKRVENRLNIVTLSGEKITFPYVTEYWAKVAQDQLCTERTAFLDLTGCKFESGEMLFNDQACYSSVARRDAYAAASAALRAVGDRLDAELQSLRLETVNYSCSRNWTAFLSSYKDGGRDRILARLKVDEPGFAERYRVFPRARARQRAIARALEQGIETPGLTRMNITWCETKTWHDNTIY